MKHSDKHTIASNILLWALPLLLLVPNIALDFTEVQYTITERLANILLPLGLYVIILSAWRRNGIAALCTLPIMVLCAFQIVLLFLYGESIIAVDMFLNVLTTNVHEASTLLINLRTAILVVLALYLPPIVLAIYATVKKTELKPAMSKSGVLAGCMIFIAGLSFMFFGQVNPLRTVFPVNVSNNIVLAMERTERSNNYANTSAAFRYGATEKDSLTSAPVVVLVIGETSRADNWQINGYKRLTNPRLSKRANLVSYTHAMSESNTTHKSVPLLMSHLDATNFNDSIYAIPGVIEAFREAGFDTYFLSAQARNGQLIDFYGEKAANVTFLTDDGKTHVDGDLVPLLNDALTQSKDKATFAVLHTYGSHFNYHERVPKGYGDFGDAGNVDANASNRQALINEYDNTIEYVDAVLDSIIATVESTGRPATVLYVADHGEDIFDDARERFLHASPTPTYWQLHVPMLLWMSDQYRAANPGVFEAANSRRADEVSSSRSTFHTLMDLAKIQTPFYDDAASLCSQAYTAPARVFLNDYNEAVPLLRSGLKDPDFAMLNAKQISVK